MIPRPVKPVAYWGSCPCARPSGHAPTRTHLLSCCCPVMFNNTSSRQENCEQCPYSMHMFKLQTSNEKLTCKPIRPVAPASPEKNSSSMGSAVPLRSLGSFHVSFGTCLLGGRTSRSQGFAHGATGPKSKTLHLFVAMPASGCYVILRPPACSLHGPSMLTSKPPESKAGKQGRS